MLYFLWCSGNMAQEADDRPEPNDLGSWSWQVYDDYIRKKIDALRPNTTVSEQVPEVSVYYLQIIHTFII